MHPDFHEKSFQNSSETTKNEENTKSILTSNPQLHPRPIIHILLTMRHSYIYQHTYVLSTRFLHVTNDVSVKRTVVGAYNIILLLHRSTKNNVLHSFSHWLRHWFMKIPNMVRSCSPQSPVQIFHRFSPRACSQ